MIRSPLPHLRHTLTAALLLAAAAGCAVAPVKNPPMWPAPPEKPRIKFVRTLQVEGDIDRGLLNRIWRIIVPVNPETVINQPMALALSPDEQRLYVGTGVKGAVIRIDFKSGKFERVAARIAMQPIGIGLDASENLYAADAAASKVLVFDAKGSFLREFGKGRIDNPRALAVDRKGQLVYVVCGVTGSSQAHRLEVFSLKGEYVRTIGKRGAGPGEFNFPSAVSVSRDGRIFVADMLNFRVQVLDAEGAPQGSFGQAGTGAPGVFDKVRGVAFDTFENVYVTDGQQGVVQIFNDRFQPLMAFGGRFLIPGFFQVPGAIVVDSRNHIFVADSATHLVSEYELINTRAEDSTAPSPPAAPPAPVGAKPAP